MMTPAIQYVAVTQVGGGVAILQFVTRGELDITGTIFNREVTDEAVAHEIIKAGLPHTSWRLIEKNEIPEDRTFRAAWRDTGKIEVDMTLAREIHREHLRALRAPRLAKLDVDYQRADETNDADLKADVTARKRALRDVTNHPDIDLAETAEDLAAVIPALLAE
jgi:hypothetical protein